MPGPSTQEVLNLSAVITSRDQSCLHNWSPQGWERLRWAAAAAVFFIGSAGLGRPGRLPFDLGWSKTSSKSLPLPPLLPEISLRRNWLEAKTGPPSHLLIEEKGW